MINRKGEEVSVHLGLEGLKIIRIWKEVGQERILIPFINPRQCHLNEYSYTFADWSYSNVYLPFTSAFSLLTEFLSENKKVTTILKWLVIFIFPNI